MFEIKEISFSGNSQSWRYFSGNLNANNDYNFGNDLASVSPQTIIVSGNGNVEYGNGSYDSLNLSAFSVDQVVEFSLAEINKGGEVINVGNGDRIFDYLVLENGSKILFEGIDRLVFRDRTIDLAITPNDPRYSQQLNLHIMGVQNAWRFTTGSEDILLGVQDSGLGMNNNSIHPDLRDTIYSSIENIADEFLHNNRDNNNSVRSDSHGTSVQGVIAAMSDNSIGIAGINWNSDISHIDVIGRNTGDFNLIGATENMINSAASQNRRLIINMSFSAKSNYTNTRFEQLVAANQDDVLFVIATGNNSENQISYPAILAQTYDNVVAVGASLPNGTRAAFSNYGEGITLTAPTRVLTTEATRNLEFSYDNSFSGTSAAAPNVAGIASLVWSANYDLTAIEIRDILSETAYDLGAEGYDLEYGHGLVNADAAVRRAIALVGEGNSISSNISAIGDKISKTLDPLGEQCPNQNWDEIDQRFTLESNFLAESSHSNQDIDLFPGDSVLNAAALDDDKPTIDDFVATDSGTPLLFAKSGNYKLGVSATNVFAHEVFDSTDRDLLGRAQDNSFDNFMVNRFPTIDK